MNDHSNMTPLFHKARNAAMAGIEHETGHREISAELRSDITGALSDPDIFAREVARSLDEAAATLVALTLANIDIGAVLADIFLAMELDPEGDAHEVITKIVKTHLMDAGFVAP